MSNLTDYKEIDKGYVAFGGNPRGGKITRKDTIKTGNLDFENVYFVRELKCNLFSISKMCDKKNGVLFNDTECIVLSLNFKLIDEGQVLLRVHRKNNIYSADLKNIVPKGGLICLFAKATSDSGSHDTQYCMENPEQAFVEYASSRIDEAKGKCYTFKPEQNNLGDTYNPSWRSHPNIRWRQPQNSQNNFSDLPNRFQSNGSISIRPFNNNPQNFNNQVNLKGLVSGTRYSEKGQNRSKTDKTEHEMEKSGKVKAKRSTKSKVKDEVGTEEILNGLTRTRLMGQ
nr:ribonuclease H-like domain-containing protein [Tanacetum cinerariifolium]